MVKGKKKNGKLLSQKHKKADIIRNQFEVINIKG